MTAPVAASSSAATHGERLVGPALPETAPGGFPSPRTPRDSAVARCRKRLRSLARQDLMQNLPIRLQVIGRVIDCHVVVREKLFGLPVIQTKHFTNLPLGKPARPVFLDG